VPTAAATASLKSQDSMPPELHANGAGVKRLLHFCPAGINNQVLKSVLDAAVVGQTTLDEYGGRRLATDGMRVTVLVRSPRPLSAAVSAPGSRRWIQSFGVLRSSLAPPS
jgi:hypothetical protein